MECFKCGVSGSRVRLFDVVSREGIVKICEKCSSEEDMPVVRKPTSFQLKESGIGPRASTGQTVYERLSRMSGIKDEGIKKSELLDKQEVSLKGLVNRNFEMTAGEIGQRDDLVDNFHWIIMRARRLKHLTQSQFAEAITEPEAAIKAVEQGVLPKNSYKIINKIENHLGIKLIKKEAVEKVREFEKKIDFDPTTTKTLTISDLQDMKKKKEEEVFERGERFPPNSRPRSDSLPPAHRRFAPADDSLAKSLAHPESPEEEIMLNPEEDEDVPEFVEKNKNDLSDEEMDRIIFWGK